MGEALINYSLIHTFITVSVYNLVALMVVDMANAISDCCYRNKIEEEKDDEDRDCTFLSLVILYVASSSARRY